MVTCLFCEGTGISPGSEQFGGHECDICQGSGKAEKQFPKESILRLYASDNEDTVDDPVATAPDAVEVTGWWHSSDGLNYYIRQDRTRLTVEGTDPYSGTPILEGEGAINGSLLKLRFYRISGVFGTARAKVAANGRKIVGTEISALTGQETQLLLTR